MNEVTCPTCGTVTQLSDISRDAGAFCRVCDYPLFWTRGAATGAGPTDLSDDTGLRRLPGTAGLVTIATFNCWNCDEPNPVNGLRCLRCAADLHPAPPVLIPPALPTIPAPIVEAPPPPPPKPPLIPPEWVPAVIAAALLVLWCLAGIIALIVR
jgi:hypothetical protein